MIISGISDSLHPNSHCFRLKNLVQSILTGEVLPASDAYITKEESPRLIVPQVIFYILLHDPKLVRGGF